MPTIYDNIDHKLLEGLKESLRMSYRGDFCSGYLNSARLEGHRS